MAEGQRHRPESAVGEKGLRDKWKDGSRDPGKQCPFTNSLDRRSLSGSPESD